MRKSKRPALSHSSLSQSAVMSSSSTDSVIPNLGSAGKCCSSFFFLEEASILGMVLLVRRMCVTLKIKRIQKRAEVWKFRLKHLSGIMAGKWLR